VGISAHACCLCPPGRRLAATAGGGRRYVSMPPCSVAAGPTRVDGSNVGWTATMASGRAAIANGGKACRHSRRRHLPRVGWRTCRHGSFAIFTEKWSFLPFQWGRWSFLTKNRSFPHVYHDYKARGVLGLVSSFTYTKRKRKSGRRLVF
jgi:hypothetical protein